MTVMPNGRPSSSTAYYLVARVPPTGDQVDAIYTHLNETTPPVEIRWSARAESLMAFESEMWLDALTERVHAALAVVLGADWVVAFERRTELPRGSGTIGNAERRD